MSEIERDKIKVFAIEIADLMRNPAKLKRALNAAAEDGYAPLIGTHCPSAEGGMIVYVLGDVSQVGAAVEPEAEEETTPEPEQKPAVDAAEPEGSPAGMDDAPAALQAEITVQQVPPPPVINKNGNGALHPEDFPHGAGIAG